MLGLAFKIMAFEFTASLGDGQFTAYLLWLTQLADYGSVFLAVTCIDHSWKSVGTICAVESGYNALNLGYNVRRPASRSSDPQKLFLGAKRYLRLWEIVVGNISAQMTFSGGRDRARRWSCTSSICARPLRARG